MGGDEQAAVFSELESAGLEETQRELGTVADFWQRALKQQQ